MEGVASFISKVGKVVYHTSSTDPYDPDPSCLPVAVPSTINRTRPGSFRRLIDRAWRL